MEQNQVLDRVKAVTGKVLSIDPKEIKPSDSFIFDLGAESMQSVELVMAFEAEFNIDMDQDQALAAQTIEGAVTVIGKYV
ncbi:MAG: acyl carrier protein [Phycisphaerae bacterium]|nr:MAG: acyl carrier protein [Phycisphaerae bacterium]